MDTPRIGKVALEITIDASIEKTWDTLINDIGDWWTKDFYTSPKTKSFILEARPGGRMYEDYGNDEGLVWAEVIIIDSPSVLELKSHLSPAFGGPVFSFLRISLETRDSQTLLSVTDHGIGALTDASMAQLSEGWTMIFESLKSYVESTH